MKKSVYAILVIIVILCALILLTTRARRSPQDLAEEIGNHSLPTEKRVVALKTLMEKGKKDDVVAALIEILQDKIILSNYGELQKQLVYSLAKILSEDEINDLVEEKIVPMIVCSKDKFSISELREDPMKISFRHGFPMLLPTSAKVKTYLMIDEYKIDRVGYYLNPYSQTLSLSSSELDYLSSHPGKHVLQYIIESTGEQDENYETNYLDTPAWKGSLKSKPVTVTIVSE